MARVKRVSLVVYGSLQVKFVKTQDDVQIQSYQDPVFRNDIICVVESIESDNRIIRRS